jgi:hypothetical protein
MPCASHRDANRTTNREWQAMQRQETQSNGEVLVIFRRGTSTDLFTQLTNQPTMTAAMSPRIAVLANAAAAEQLRHHPQVEAVIMRPEDEIPNSLNQAERLFVSAWAKNQRASDKVRPGEGLAWDAPGFLPPDAPKKR